MTAPVRIEARAWSDLRFATLARLLGLSEPDHALIKVARLWSWQTEHFSSKRPTYVVDRDTIESVLGKGGPEALVRSHLATETPDGWRMHGTQGSIEWCEALTEKRSRAGRARAEKALRGIDGRLLSNGDHCPPAHAGCAGPASTSTPPAQSSAPDPAPDPAPEILATGSFPELVLSPDSQANPTKLKRARARKPRVQVSAHRMPPEWAPRQQEIDRAAAMHLQLGAELERFRDHHTAKGSTFVDWDAAFRTWIGNAVRFANGTLNGHSNGRSGPQRAKSPIELQMERIAMLKAQERAENK